MTSISTPAASQRYVVPEQDNHVTQTIIQHLVARYHSPQYHWSDASPSLVTAGRSVRSILQEFPNIEKPIVTAFRTAKTRITRTLSFVALFTIPAVILPPFCDLMLGQSQDFLSELKEFVIVGGVGAVIASAACLVTDLFGACKGFSTQRQNIKSGLAQAEGVRARSLHMIKATRRARSIMPDAV